MVTCVRRVFSSWSSGFPNESASRYLIRDRNHTFGAGVRHFLDGLTMEEVLIAPRSSWQSPFAERLIGSIRRECLDYVVILNEGHLRRLLSAYL